jgi:hypothetical protein
MLKTIVTAMALGISVIVTESTEAEILVTCVYDDNSPCLAKPPQTTLPNNSTWYIPAIGENEPGSETSMEIRFPDFTYSQVSINGGSFIDRPGPDNGGFFEVLDPDGSRSDVVLIYPPDIAFDNRIVIRSDPDIGSPLQFPKPAEPEPNRLK